MTYIALHMEIHRHFAIKSSTYLVPLIYYLTIKSILKAPSPHLLRHFQQEFSMRELLNQL